MEVWKHCQRHRTHFVIGKKKALAFVYPFVVPHESVIVLMKGQKIWHLEWNSLICLMARAIVVIAWPPKLSVNTVLASRRATAPPSSRRSGKQSHAPVGGRNYQSASQPSNWGIRLNSVKWHFSGGGTRRSRLWIKVIPRQRSGFQSSRRTSGGSGRWGAVTTDSHGNRLGIVADAAIFRSSQEVNGSLGGPHDEWALSNAPRQYPHRF